MQTKCPICQNDNLTCIYEIENAVCNDGFICKSVSNSKTITRGDIVLQYCNCCEFVVNGKFESAKVLYDDRYNNNQMLSSKFNEYIEDVIKHIRNFNFSGGRILEIGCGNGEFLKKISDAIDNAYCMGYDPSYTENENLAKYENIHIKNEYFSGGGGVEYSFIIIRHILEHIENLNEFIAIVINSLEQNGILMVEVPDFNWILENKAYMDILYQHVNYFNNSSLTKLLKDNGLAVLETISAFEGQYLIVFAKKVKEKIKIDMFVKEFKQYKNKWELLLRDKRKRFAIWGALGKGVNFVDIVDKEHKNIVCAIDINPALQNGYLAGAAIPIIAPKDIEKFKITDIIVMNPNYKDEISDMIKEMNLIITLHKSNI
jgi:2-polyprenyl-3-methyl-5-hydroxy-6-metoxy-1,4-benzoquinol methylase